MLKEITGIILLIGYEGILPGGTGFIEPTGGITTDTLMRGGSKN